MNLDLSKWESEVPKAVQEAEAFVVSDATSYEFAGKAIVRLKGTIKAVREWIQPHKEAADKVHAGLCAEEKRLVAMYEKPLKIYDAKAMAWKQEQDRIRAARELEEKERQRKEEEERRLSQAIAAEQAGEKEIAENILDEVAPLPAVTLPKTVPKVEGLSTRKTFDFEIVAPLAINRTYLKPDEVKIRQIVRSMGKDAEKMIGGIRVIEVESFAGRTR